MAKKFVIADGDLKIGNPDFHKELVQDRKTCKGGGYWSIDTEKLMLYLFGESHDFGQATYEDVLEMATSNTIFSMRFSGYAVYYSSDICTEKDLVNEFKPVCFIQD